MLATQLITAGGIASLFAAGLWLAGAVIAWHWQDLFDEVYIPPHERLLISLRWPIDAWKYR